MCCFGVPQQRAVRLPPSKYPIKAPQSPRPFPPACQPEHDSLLNLTKGGQKAADPVDKVDQLKAKLSLSELRLELVDFVDGMSCILTFFGQLEGAIVFLHHEELFTGPDGALSDYVERDSWKLVLELLGSRVECRCVLFPSVFLGLLSEQDLFVDLVLDLQVQPLFSVSLNTYFRFLGTRTPFGHSEVGFRGNLCRRL